MSTTRTIVSLAFVALSPLLACAPEAKTPAPPDPHTLREELMKVDSDFDRVSGERGAAAAFRAYLDDDAAELPAAGDPIRGREAIAKGLEPAAGEPAITLRWKPLDARASAAGDLGFTYGTYELSIPSAKGDPKKIHGKYTTIWKRDAAGAWKAIVDVGNEAR